MNLQNMHRVTMLTTYKQYATRSIAIPTMSSQSLFWEN